MIAHPTEFLNVFTMYMIICIICPLFSILPIIYLPYELSFCYRIRLVLDYIFSFKKYYFVYYIII